jgi:type II secretory pathway pseudopilin PulG
MAIASLVCGILNVFPLSVVAIVLGHISLSQIKKSAGRIQGKGLAIAGLVLGYLGIAAIPFILIIAAIAIPNLLRAKIAADESSAVQSLRVILAAEVSYRNQSGAFTCNLADLSSVGVSDSSLINGQKNGYNFTLQNCGSESGGPTSRFEVLATPVTQHASGSKAFCTDQSAVVRYNASGSAPDCLKHGSLLP